MNCQFFARECVCGLLSAAFVSALLFCMPSQANAGMLLGSEQLVRAGELVIEVPGDSVPSFVDWNNDGLKDLIVGEGGAGFTPKVRLYLNEGAVGDPLFSDFNYLQSDGADITGGGGACLGIYPRVVYWGPDDKKDLILGHFDGTVELFENTGTDEQPIFTGSELIFEHSHIILPPDPYLDIDVGLRAAPTFVDWNNDGSEDLIVGGYDPAKIFVYEDCQCDPDEPLVHLEFAQNNGEDLVVPNRRSTPVVLDLDGDGKKDLLTGNSEGQLLLYSNTGTDASPSFSGYVMLETAGVPIDLDGMQRSQPFVTDWNDDGQLDILVGSGDGLIRIYQAVPEPATLALFATGALMLCCRPLVRRARRKACNAPERLP